MLNYCSAMLVLPLATLALIERAQRLPETALLTNNAESSALIPKLQPENEEESFSPLTNWF